MMEDILKQFADDPRYVALGVTIHRHNLKKFKQAINACAFA